IGSAMLYIFERSGAIHLIETYYSHHACKCVRIGILQTLKGESYQNFLDDLYIHKADSLLKISCPSLRLKAHYDTTYSDLLHQLERGQIDMAFSSPYTFLEYQHGKDPDSKIEDLLVKTIRKQLYTGYVYYSTIIWDSSFHFDPTKLS